MSRFLYAIILLFLSASFAHDLWSIPGIGSRTPGWDMAAHGLDGIYIVEAIRRLAPLEFLQRLGRMNYWPPLFPFLEAPVFAVFGYEFHVARRLVILLSAVTIVVIGWTANSLHKSCGMAAGFLAATLYAISPIVQRFSSLEMLEVPGTLLTLLCLIFYCNYLTTPQQQLWRRCSLAALALFFTKFNYGILWLAPWLVWEIKRDTALRRWLIEKGLWLWRRLPWRSTFFRVLGVYIFLLIYIEISGGWLFSVAGQNIDIRSAKGNPIYIAIILTLIFLSVKQRPLLQEIKALYGKAPYQVRGVGNYFVLPVLLWFLYPPNFNTFLISTFNQARREKFWELENFIFYPRSWILDYSPTDAIGWLTIGSCLIGLMLWRYYSEKIRFLWWLAAFNVFACVVHPNHIDRYFFTVAPLLWLLTALLLTGLVASFLKRCSVPQAVLIAGTLTVAGSIYLMNAVSPPAARLARDFYSETRPENVRTLAASICTQAARQETTAVIGFDYVLNPALLQWVCYLEQPDMPTPQLPRTLNRFGLRTEYLTPEEISSSPKVKQFVLVERTGALAAMNDDTSEGKAWRPLFNFFTKQSAVEEIASPHPNYRLYVTR